MNLSSQSILLLIFFILGKYLGELHGDIMYQTETWGQYETELVSPSEVSPTITYLFLFYMLASNGQGMAFHYSTDVYCFSSYWLLPKKKQQNSSCLPYPQK